MTNRFNQIKELQVSKSREEIETFPIGENLGLLGKDIKLSQDLEEYITSYMLSDGFSYEFLENLIEKVRIYKGINIQRDAPLTKVLFNLIINTVLLPSYKSNGVDYYDDIKKVVERSIKDFNKKIEKLIDGSYSLELGNIGELDREININMNELMPPLDDRIFGVGKGFGYNTFKLDEEKNLYKFRVSIDLDSKENKFKTQLSQERITKIFNEKILSIIIPYILFNDKKIYKYIKTDEEGNILNMPELINKLPFVLSTNIENNGSGQIGDNIGGMYFCVDIYSTDELEEDYSNIIEYLTDLIHINNLMITSFKDELGLKFYSNNVRLFSSGEYLSVKINKKENKDGNNFEELVLNNNQKVSLDDIGGLDEAKEEVKKIIALLRNEAKAKEFGAQPVKGIIFEGKPGTGKTLLARAIASEANANIYNIKISDIMNSPYINSGTTNITNMFKFIREQSKKSKKRSIVILDELDALFKKRDSNGSRSQEDIKVVNTFLSEVGGIKDDENIIFIGTTNMINDIDPAITRSGRMSKVIKIGLPDEKALENIYHIHINIAIKKAKKAKEIFEEVDIKELAKITKGLTGADVESIIEAILVNKFFDEITNGNFTKADKSDFEKVINQIKSKQEEEKSREIGFHANM